MNKTDSWQERFDKQFKLGKYFPGGKELADLGLPPGLPKYLGNAQEIKDFIAKEIELAEQRGYGRAANTYLLSGELGTFASKEVREDG
ncbi:MAG: hypothetical protein NUV80_06065 [Candidatus Berkelbacteria bacterium]|nr:hypothetical protein [Candidatus Berkelbacteria bacterium]